MESSAAYVFRSLSVASRPRDRREASLCVAWDRIYAIMERCGDITHRIDEIERYVQRSCLRIRSRDTGMDRRDSGEESTRGMMHLGSSSLSHARSSHDTEHSVPCRDEEIERLRAENAMLRESLVQYKKESGDAVDRLLVQRTDALIEAESKLYEEKKKNQRLFLELEKHTSFLSENLTDLSESVANFMQKAREEMESALFFDSHSSPSDMYTFAKSVLEDMKSILVDEAVLEIKKIEKSLEIDIPQSNPLDSNRRAEGEDIDFDKRVRQIVSKVGVEPARLLVALLVDIRHRFSLRQNEFNLAMDQIRATLADAQRESFISRQEKASLRFLVEELRAKSQESPACTSLASSTSSVPFGSGSSSGRDPSISNLLDNQNQDEPQPSTSFDLNS